MRHASYVIREWGNGTRRARRLREHEGIRRKKEEGRRKKEEGRRNKNG
jgi:hypothetical protein